MSSRVLVLGIDGLPPAVFDRFLGEGVLPNCSALLAAGGRLDVVPTLPALTAPGWLTIASGSHPATLGITNILLPAVSGPPDAIRNGFDRRLSRGEYLWESLARAGRPATVVKFPGSWPPLVESDLLSQVDGAGGYADITCRHDALSSAAYLCGSEVPDTVPASCCAIPRGYDEHWRIDSAGDSGWIGVTAREPMNWTNLPPHFDPAFECVLPVVAMGTRRRKNLYLVAGELDGSAVAVLAWAKDATALATLRAGDWTPSLDGEDQQGQYTFRLKLLDLDLPTRRLHVYRTQGHRTSGFCRPATLDDRLLAEVGPVSEWTGTFDFMARLIDLPTQLEIYDQHTRWLENVIRTLGRESWDAFFTHWHVIEYAHHIAGAALDPVHPRHEVDQASYLDFLRKTYQLLDRLVGTAVEVAEAQLASLAVLSDHGHDTVHTLFYLNDFLRERGWIVTEEHDDRHEAGADDPGMRIDWARTRAYGLFPGMVIVRPGSGWYGDTDTATHSDHDALVTEIREALRCLRDPRTGQPVVSAVLEEAEMTALGQGADERVDLIFTMERGYEPATRLRAHADGLFEITEPGAELTSGHGSFHPVSPSARTLAVLRDPRVGPGTTGRFPVQMVDLLPTLAELIDAPVPQGCDGRPLDLVRLGLSVPTTSGDIVGRRS